MTGTRREILKARRGDRRHGAVRARGRSRQAQFPSRTVRIVVPFPAGATTDLLARLIAQRPDRNHGPELRGRKCRRRRRLDRRRPGRQGRARRPHAAVPQHHLLDHHLVAAVCRARAEHDFDDFVPVSVGAYVPLLLLANHSVPANDLKEFVAYAKTTTTPLFYGSTGPGSIMHLMGEVLKRDAGIKMDHVPFRGAAPLVHGPDRRPRPFRRRPALQLARARALGRSCKALGGGRPDRSRCRTCRPCASSASPTSSCKAGTASSRPRARPSR